MSLLRRSVEEIASGADRCRRCRRTPLVGERVYIYKGGEMLCELCRVLKPDAPESWQLVHNTKAGDVASIRITDRRSVR